MKKFLRGPFSFSGRIGRGRWWLNNAIATVGFFLAAASIIILGIALSAGPDDIKTVVITVVALIVMVVFVLIAASAGVRRLHDRGKHPFWLAPYYVLPGWLFPNHIEGSVLDYAMIAASLVVTGAAVVDLGVLRGTPGDNAYGPNPLAPAA